MNPLVRSTVAIILVSLGGCAAEPVLDTSASAEQSFDGLLPYQNTIVDQAWAREDLDLSGYTKIKLEGAGIQFRRTTAAAASRSTVTRGGVTEFPIDEQNREKLRQTIGEAFLSELSKLERFELTDETGPEVLIVRGALLDVVSNVPPQSAGRVDVYLDKVGEATLVLELVDSQTDTVLLRAVDRRAAENRGQRMAFPSSSVTNWAEVRRLAQYWARLLRERLDAFATAMS